MNGRLWTMALAMALTVGASGQNDSTNIMRVGYSKGSPDAQAGAVEKVTEERLNKGLVTSSIVALSGQAAGVQVSNGGNQAAMVSAVRVRGTSSLAGRNDPLVMIDGVASDLAKLMLNAEVYTGTPRWEEAIEYCDAIEGLGYRLEPLYATNFKIYNEVSSENIFTIPMDRDLYSNQMQYIYRSLHYRHAAANGFVGENGSCATLKALQVFGYNTDNPDSRFYQCYWADTVLNMYGKPVTDRSGKPLVYYPWEVRLDLSGSPYVETAGARMQKYETDWNAAKDGKLMDNDIVLFRFADVLLMRAEAKLRSGQDGQDDFNAIRNRALMPLRQLNLDNLLDERLLELAWEGWRRQDLIRFGKYESLYDGPDKVDESDGHTCLFPIPNDAKTLNHNLKQNDGY